MYRFYCQWSTRCFYDQHYIHIYIYIIESSTITTQQLPWNKAGCPGRGVKVWDCPCPGPLSSCGLRRAAVPSSLHHWGHCSTWPRCHEEAAGARAVWSCTSPLLLLSLPAVPRCSCIDSPATQHQHILHNISTWYTTAAHDTISAHDRQHHYNTWYRTLVLSTWYIKYLAITQQ